jgi:hypothetical protein
MKALIFGTICLLLVGMALAVVGCGGTTGSNPITPNQKVTDPSGSWALVFTDSNNNQFRLSALFNQVGAVVTALNIQEVGNGASFQCLAQRDASMANGLVQNVSTFSGDFNGLFGTVHFTTTLNDAGTHASGSYTITPPQSGNCLGVALTGSLVADEVPSMSGNWTGTLTCTSNCPTGGTTGTVHMTLAQDDATGAVTGTYTVTGLPGISTGNFGVPDINDFISGASMQEKMVDQNGRTFAIAGGPVSLNSPGLGQDGSFAGIIAEGVPTTPNVIALGTTYSVSMSH